MVRYRLVDEDTGETVNIVEIGDDDSLLEMEEMSEILGFYLEEE